MGADQKTRKTSTKISLAILLKTEGIKHKGPYKV